MEKRHDNERQPVVPASMKNRDLLRQGLVDAAGFLIGALLGFGLGRALGFDLFASGYDSGSMIAIILCGTGGGLGVQLARRWRRKD